MVGFHKGSITALALLLFSGCATAPGPGDRMIEVLRSDDFRAELAHTGFFCPTLDMDNGQSALPSLSSIVHSQMGFLNASDMPVSSVAAEVIASFDQDRFIADYIAYLSLLYRDADSVRQKLGQLRALESICYDAVSRIALSKVSALNPRKLTRQEKRWFFIAEKSAEMKFLVSQLYDHAYAAALSSLPDTLDYEIVTEKDRQTIDRQNKALDGIADRNAGRLDGQI